MTYAPPYYIIAAADAHAAPAAPSSQKSQLADRIRARLDAAAKGDAVRWASVQPSGEPKVELLIEGSLQDVLRRVDDKLVSHNRTAVDFTSGPVEQRTQTYPLAALQQFVRNAVLHRTYEATHAPVRVYWYDDRIEILSPGGPFGAVSAENFGAPGLTDYRNPNLAEALRVLGFVQHYGAGIPTAERELKKNGNPPPEFQVEATHVLVVVRRVP